MIADAWIVVKRKKILHIFTYGKYGYFAESLEAWGAAQNIIDRDWEKRKEYYIAHLGIDFNKDAL